MVNQMVTPQALGSFVYLRLSAKPPGTCSPVRDVQHASSPPRAGMAALGCKAEVAVVLPNVAF